MACTTYCTQNCSRNCRYDCTGGCGTSCSGTCEGGCSGCSGSCSGGCTGTCTGSCSSCTGTCTGSCVNTCQGKCNTACTAQAQADLLAHLGEDIAVGNPIKATEYLQLKTAIDAEYTRRGKSAPESFVKVPAAKELVLLSISQKILTDIYAFDSLPEHDWRNVFESGNVVSPSKWQPAILYLKDLSTQIVP